MMKRVINLKDWVVFNDYTEKIVKLNLTFKQACKLSKHLNETKDTPCYIAIEIKRK